MEEEVPRGRGQDSKKECKNDWEPIEGWEEGGRTRQKSGEAAGLVGKVQKGSLEEGEQTSAEGRGKGRCLAEGRKMGI